MLTVDGKPDETLGGKLAKLRERVSDAGRLAVAFSGGVDSTLLLTVAADVLGDNVVAVTVASPFMPRSEQAAAEAFCAERGIGFLRVEADPLSDEAIRANAPDRCYRCKRSLFALIQEAAARAGFHVVVDGSNADDADDFRPGMRALRELGIVSPLMDAGLTKSDIYALSSAMGLATAHKSPAACLATRIPYGTPLDAAVLSRVEAAEDFVRGLGFSQVRVRAHGDLARIEVDADDIGRLASDAVRRDVDARLWELGFRYACVDLAGYRSGSMNTDAVLAAGDSASDASRGARPQGGESDAE